MKTHQIWTKAPASIRRHLQRGERGDVGETPKPGAARFRRVQHEIIGNNGTAVGAAGEAATRAGLRTILLETPIVGEAANVADGIAQANALVPDLLLRYPVAAYLFVAPQQPELAAQLEQGLNAAVRAGSFQRLHAEHYLPTIRRYLTPQLRVIELQKIGRAHV